MSHKLFSNLLILSLIVLVFVSIFSFHTKTAEASSWYNASWGYRKSINIDHTKISAVNNTILSDFPVLVSITDTDLKFGGGGHVALASGQDIIFTDSNGTTLLNYEIEKYTPSTGELIAWVKVSSLDPTASNHTIYAYFGNVSAGSENAVTKQGTWDNNFISVYHLGDGSTLSLTDSKGNYNLTNNATIPTSTSQINGAAQFDGSTSYVYSNSFVDSQPSITASIWAKDTSNDGSVHAILDLAWGQISVKISKFNIYFNIPSACNIVYTNAYNQMHLYAWVYNSSNQYWAAYVDGDLLGTCPSGTSSVFANKPVLTLGSTFKGQGGNYFGGIMDEARFSNSARSADWIKTEYNNQNATSTFYTLGSAEPYFPAPIISSFTANPSFIASGGNSTLSWNVTGTVNYITIDPISFATTTAFSSKLVNPNVITTYTLSAGNTIGTSTQDVTITVDTTVPTTPSSLTVSTTTPSSIALSWAVSTDNVVVTGYNIYRNGTKIATIIPGTYINTLVNSTSFDYYLDIGLAASTQYTYKVEAFDGQGNTSTQSSNLLATTANQVIPSQPLWNMGYYTPFASLPISEIYWPSLTHIIHVGAIPNSDGTLDLTTYNISGTASSLITAGHTHNVKVLLDLSDGTISNFQSAIANHSSSFVTNIMNVVNTYGYDGVTIDWESGINFSSMATLVSNLRTQLGTKLLVGDGMMGDQSNWASLINNLDRINLMGYDLTGLWDPYLYHDSSIYAPNTSVYSINLLLNSYLTAGISTSKINIGLPFYGYVYQGGCQTIACTDGVNAPLQTWATAPTHTQRIPTYLAANYDLTTANNAWHWDITAHEPYLSINDPVATNDKFVTFENTQSITDKVNYTQVNGLGGVFNWNMNTDYFLGGSTVSEKYPLSNAITLALTAGSDIMPPVVSLTAPATDSTLSSSSVTLSATASDVKSSVTSVQFKLDNANIGSIDITSPYGITWDSNSVGDGSHTLSAVATDAYGNIATSSATVTIHNAAPTPPTPVLTPTPTPPSSGHRQDISTLISNTTSTTSLQNQIAQLTIQLNSLLALKNNQTSTTSSQYSFSHDLSLHMRGVEVKQLQEYLNTHGFIIATTGAGSLGNETSLFGSLTYKALQKFQNSIGLPATGFFGPMTRGYIGKNVK